MEMESGTTLLPSIEGAAVSLTLPLFPSLSQHLLCKVCIHGLFNALKMWGGPELLIQILALSGTPVDQRKLLKREVP